MAAIRYDRPTSGANVLVAYGRDQLGRRSSLTRSNGTSTSYSCDALSRLASLSHDFGGSATTQDLAIGFGYNPTSQIVSVTLPNDAYAWTAHGSGTTSTPDRIWRGKDHVWLCEEGIRAAAKGLAGAEGDAFERAVPFHFYPEPVRGAFPHGEADLQSMCLSPTLR